MFFGRDEEMNGEMFRSDFPVSNENVGKLGLLSLGGRNSSDRRA